MEFAKTTIPTKEALSMDILPLFCDTADFCQFFELLWKKRLLSSGARQRDRAALCLSKAMTLITLFHASDGSGQQQRRRVDTEANHGASAET
jgi:hypothetical protein